MEIGKYIDLEEKGKSRVYTFFDRGDGKPSLSKETLHHAIAGDSDSIYCAIPESITKDLTEDEIVEVSDVVTEMINDEYPSFLEMAFNVPRDRQDQMETEREVVSDKSFFLTKKRYIMHVTNDEGKKVDKMKVMGVELIKSDQSQFKKEALQRIVDAVLDGRGLDDLLQIVNDLKKEIRTKSIKEVGTPISCNTLKKYQDMYEMTGSMKSFPYMVKGAMHYNELRSHREPEIVPGDKILFAYVQHPSISGISIPLNINTIPEFLNEIPIDYDKEWNKLNKAIVNYLEALGWDLKSRNKKKKKDLFGIE